MPRKNVRVKIPTDPSAVIALAGKIQAKNAELGDASPIKDLDDAETFAPAVTRAAANDKDADDFATKAETSRGERNKDLPVVKEGVRARRDALLGKYRSNPKKLTEWGFGVDDSRQGGDTAEAPK